MTLRDAKSTEAPVRRGSGCLALFALPFAAVGVGALYLLADNIWQWTRMRDWVAAPAEIVSVHLVESRGKNSSTYRVDATYRYEYKSASYTGDRVAIDKMSDNIGSFHQDLYRALNSAQRSHTLYRCFVNPVKPSEAILSRDLRWQLLGFEALFMLAFGGVGFGLLWGVRRGRALQRRELDLANLYPGQPWRWKSEWRDGRISSDSKSATVSSWIFAVFWNLLSSPVLFFIGDEVAKKGNYLALVALLFPIVGVGLIVWSVRNTIRWRKFGRVILRLDTLPVMLGGTLRGRIEMRARIESQDGFHVRFACINRVTTGSGKNSSSKEHILYQEQKTIPDTAVEAAADGWQLPVAFEVPADRPQTDSADSRNEILWFVEATAAVPGIDFLSRFVVPVFKCAGDTKDEAQA